MTLISTQICALYECVMFCAWHSSYLRIRDAISNCIGSDWLSLLLAFAHAPSFCTTLTCGILESEGSIPSWMKTKKEGEKRRANKNWDISCWNRVLTCIKGRSPFFTCSTPYRWQNSDGHLPSFCGSANMYHFSSPPQWIIVKYSMRLFVLVIYSFWFIYRFFQKPFVVPHLVTCAKCVMQNLIIANYLFISDENETCYHIIDLDITSCSVLKNCIDLWKSANVSYKVYIHEKIYELGNEFSLSLCP